MRRGLAGIMLILLFLGFQACQRQYYPEAVRWDQMTMKESIPDDSAMVRLIVPYKRALSDQMEAVIGYLDTPLYHRHPEGSLGSWIADALAEEMEEYTGEAPDFALHNYGGIRLQMIPEGPLTVGKIYELVPFDNALVDLRADSATVNELISHFMKRGGWPLSHTIDVHCIGDGYAIEIAGQPLSGEREYHIAMPDYIANGGDDCFFLRDNPRVSTGYFVRDVIIEYIKEEKEKGQKLFPSNDRRIHCIQEDLK